MHFRNTVLASVSVAALTACGGESGSNLIYANEEVINAEDYVGVTFPLRYVGVDKDTSALKRSTGTITFISESELRVSFDGVNETVFEIVAGEFAGPTLDVDTDIITSALTGATGETDSALYAGFVGFETNPADMPDAGFWFYDDADGAAIILSNGEEFEPRNGGVFLNVNFGTGSVTGSLFEETDGDLVATIVNGNISGNGITGGVVINDGLSELPTTDDSVSGTFFGQDQASLAGTFGGTTTTTMGEIDFVGAFAGIKTSPDF